MTIKHLTIALVSTLGISGAANAAVSFTGGGVDDFWHTTDNWTDDVDSTTGLPTGGEDTTIVAGQNAVVNANDTAGIGKLTVVAGSSLTINSGNTLQLNHTKAGIVNGTLNVNGKFTLLGGNGSNLTIGNAGVVNVGDGGFLDARKTTTLSNGGGVLNIGSTASTWVPQDKLAIGDGSLLHFDVLGGSVSTIAGSTLDLGLHNTNSLLDLDLAGTGVGTYDLITGIQNITWFSGSSIVNSREFKESVSNLGAGLEYDVVYDTIDPVVGAKKISLVITAVPEPSSTTLLGLGALALILRRRK